jgi:LEA14-like dessication related protein
MSAWKLVVIVSAFIVSGCTNIQKLQELQVNLIKITPIGLTGLSPRFAVELSVLNPNNQDLEINGVSMQLDIADQKIFTGVSNQIPPLVAYSATPVTIETNVNLIQVYKLLTYIGQHANDDIKYQLKTTIDPKGFISFNVNKEGVLNDASIKELMKQGQ